MTKPKKRPITFPIEEVKDIIEGKKTQTRRLIKNLDGLGDDGNLDYYETQDNTVEPTTNFCPYGRVGDYLWVKESWKEHTPVIYGAERWVHYKTEIDSFCCKNAHWRSPLHMPQWASRLVLLITNVRIERLQTISKADVVAEGITIREGYPIEDVFAGWHEPFAQLWDNRHVIKWDFNPLVWVIEFKKI